MPNRSRYRTNRHYTGIDIAVLVPAVYFWLASRAGWPRLSVIPVFLLSLVAAHQIISEDYSDALAVLAYAAIPLAGWRRGRMQGDAPNSSSQTERTDQ